MKIFTALAFLFLVAYATADSNVLDLTSDNFADTLAEYDLVLVEFFAPWCGHCKALAPEYEKAADEIKELGLTKVALAKVDCTVEKALAQQYGIQGFPTLKLFKDGKSSDYKKARKAEAIVEFLQAKMLPPYVVVATADELKAVQDSGKKTVVGLFADPSSEGYKSFVSTASDEMYESSPFAVVTSADLGLGAEGSIKIISGADVVSEHDGSMTIDEFLFRSLFPLASEVNEVSYGVATKRNLPIAIFFFDPEDKETTVKLAEEIADVYIGSATFLYGDGKAFARNMPSIGASGLKLPTVSFIHESKSVAFNEEEEWTADSAKAFAKAYFEGTAVGNRMSEPIPEDNDGPVKVIVGKQFEELVTESEIPVFIEFYAPWCGHCKKLAPVWDELGQAVKEKGLQVVIAKIDATANWYPSSFEITGFPSIFYCVKGSKPKAYNGDRDLSDFKEFLEDNLPSKPSESTSDTPADEPADDVKDEL